MSCGVGFVSGLCWVQLGFCFGSLGFFERFEVVGVC